MAALSGDARRCLDICRRAVEIAEREGETQQNTIDKKNKDSRRKSVRSPSKKTSKDGSQQERRVGMKHVECALKEMFSSPKILALQSLALMEEMFIKAVISEFRRSGLEEAQFTDVDILTFFSFSNSFFFTIFFRVSTKQVNNFR